MGAFSVHSGKEIAMELVRIDDIWESKLYHRASRYVRLIELDAPDEVVAKEKALILQAVSNLSPKGLAKALSGLQVGMEQSNKERDESYKEPSSDMENVCECHVSRFPGPSWCPIHSPKATCPDCGLTYIDVEDWSGPAHSERDCRARMKARIAELERQLKSR